MSLDKVIWNKEHPYNPDKIDNDFSIVKLKTALTLNDNVQPACLPDPTFNPVNATCIVSGWGDLSPGSIG